MMKNPRISNGLWVGLLVAVGLLGFCRAATAATAWYDNNWLWRQEVTIPDLGNSATLGDFPTLVKLTDQANPLFGNARAGGGDIFFTFTDTGGTTTKLKHEVEYYSDTGSKELDAWIRLPELPSGGATIQMYYGNTVAPDQQEAAAVWDNNFKMVQHLGETAQTLGSSNNDHLDSTQYDNDGEAHNDVVMNAAGKTGFGDAFDGINDYVDCGNDSSLDLTAGMTIEAWVKWNDFKNFGTIVDKMAGGGVAPSNYYMWSYAGGTIRAGIGNGTAHNGVDFTGSLSIDQWYHVVFKADGSSLYLYINGLEEATAGQTITPNANDQPVRISKYSTSGFTLDGLIDEVRISDVARSSDWLLASFNNQSPDVSNATFGEAIPVPEPSSLALLVLGSLCWLAHARRGCRKRN